MRVQKYSAREYSYVSPTRLDSQSLGRIAFPVISKSFVQRSFQFYADRLNDFEFVNAVYLNSCHVYTRRKIGIIIVTLMKIQSRSEMYIYN